MTRSIDNGGPTHVRYAHRARPTRVDVVCPACGERAEARLGCPDGVGAGTSAVVGDLSPEWSAGGWSTTCLSCPKRLSGTTYEGLPPLYWRFEVGDCAVWAWNRAHLAFLLRVVSGVGGAGQGGAGQGGAGEAYGWLATYVPGAWKSRRNAPRIAAAIRRLLDTGHP